LEQSIEIEELKQKVAIRDALLEKYERATPHLVESKPKTKSTKSRRR